MDRVGGRERAVSETGGGTYWFGADQGGAHRGGAAQHRGGVVGGMVAGLAGAGHAGACSGWTRGSSVRCPTRSCLVGDRGHPCLGAAAQRDRVAAGRGRQCPGCFGTHLCLRRNGGAGGNPDWPAARWAAWLASALWIAGLLSLISVLPALYPDGQLPGPRWKWPVAAATLGTVLLTFGLLLDPGAYDDIAPGGSPVSMRVPGWVGLTWGVLTGASCAGWHAHDLGDDGGPVDPSATD